MSATLLETDHATRLRAAIGRLSRRLRPTEAGGGLTPTQSSVLHTVLAHDSIRLSELAQHERLNPTMLSRVVAALVERGLVRRVTDSDDRRSARLEATAAARRLRDRMRKERDAKLEPLIEALPAEDRAALMAALPALELLADMLGRERAR